MVKLPPEISIILPTYNRAHLLSRAIDSVLNQTYQNFELIIIDDGSSDDTGKIISNYKTPSIKYIKFKKNKGANIARNIGIQSARGKYIAFQDSDDKWHKGKLEKQIDVIKSNLYNVQIVFSSFWYIESGLRKYFPTNADVLKSSHIKNEVIKNNFIAMPTALIERKCFEENGLFDESLPRYQDWELFIRFSQYYDFKFIKEPLVDVYREVDCISMDRHAAIKGIEIILKQHQSIFYKNKLLFSKHFFYLGKLCFLESEIIDCKRYFLRSIKLNCFNVKSVFSLLIILISEKLYEKILRYYYFFKNKM